MSQDDDCVEYECESSEFGCCFDNYTNKESDDDSCCRVSTHGCCPDSQTTRTSEDDNCGITDGCDNSEFGCCTCDLFTKKRYIDD